MNERDNGVSFIDYERISRLANNLYKEAERMVGTPGKEEMTKQLKGTCAHMEEQAFYFSETLGLGSTIRDAHARFVVQNFYSAGNYNDVIRSGIRAKLILGEGSEDTLRQNDTYVEASTNNIMEPSLDTKVK